MNVSSSRWIGASLGLCVLIGAVCGQGCRRPQPAVTPGVVVARVGEATMTTADVEAEIGLSAPGYRAQQFLSPARKKALLASMVRQEMLAAEARRRGYSQSPAVARATKQALVAALIEKEVEDALEKEGVADGEIERYYRDHQAEFMTPEQVRVRQLVARDRAKAGKLAARMAQAIKTGPESSERVFRALASESEDATSRARGGDLGTLTRGSTAQPRAVVEAAFALTATGAVSQPVETSHGFHILQLIDRIPAGARRIAEARPQIHQKILGEKRRRKLDELVAAIGATTKVEVFEDRLAEVQVRATPPRGVRLGGSDGGTTALK